jgi:hypothetical protein
VISTMCVLLLHDQALKRSANWSLPGGTVPCVLVRELEPGSCLICPVAESCRSVDAGSVTASKMEPSTQVCSSKRIHTCPHNHLHLCHVSGWQQPPQQRLDLLKLAL